MRRLFLLAVLAMCVFAMLPAASALASDDYTITDIEWWIAPAKNKIVYHRYATVKMHWGIFVHTDPAWTHEIGDPDEYLYLPTTVRLFREYRVRPRWRLVKTWNTTTQAALRPTSSVQEYFNFSAKWTPAWYRVKVRITEPVNGFVLNQYTGFRITN